MIAGGFDNFSEEGSYKFANMGATGNSHTAFGMGRELNKMSRPTASTHDGVSHTPSHPPSSLGVDMND